MTATGRPLPPEPRWDPDPKHSGLSKSGETRESFERRLAAWRAAVQRERQG